MTDTPSPAQLDVREAGPRKRSRISWIWLVPIAALGVILSVAWSTYQDRGILIEIEFENGSGISKETPLKYRDITVGLVEKVSFADNLEVVLVHVRVDKDIAPYLDDDAIFWVVRPDVTLRGVSGLDTVLSGAYIAGKWDTEADVDQREFIGLEDPPLLATNDAGSEIVLRAPTGASLAQGAPILHKGLQVGFLDEPVLDPNGNGVIVSAFIEEQYARLVTTNTRFWDTSGFSVSVGASGLALNVDSIASLIEGGIAFDTVVSGGEPLGQGPRVDTFDLFDSEQAARESLFESPDRNTMTVGILFDETVNGLRQGSAVKYQGVNVGEVSAINAIVVEENGNNRVRLRTTLGLSPSRLGISDDTTDEDAMQIFASFVAQGMRARLVTGNILTGALEVELVDVENADLMFLDPLREPFPIIPTTESLVSDVSATAEGVLDRINNLPIEELMQGAVDLMASIEALATDGDLKAAPLELRTILADISTIIASDGIQGAPDTLQTSLEGIQEVVAEIATIVASATEADLVGTLSDTLNTANDTVATIGTASEALPDIIAELQALASKANALEVEALLAQTNQTLANIDAILVDETTTAIPATVTAALDEIRGLVTDVREGGAVENLTAALEDTSTAAQAISESVETLPELAARATNLVAQLEAATANLPQITAQIEQLTIKANSVEIDDLVAQATQTLDTIDGILLTEGANELPAALTGALDELNVFLATVREGGAVENVNAALAAAAQAATSIDTAARGLPGLSTETSRLVNTINAVAGAYGEQSRFSNDTAATLRDIQAAADAVTSLARTIQRNPSSLLTGR
ncbi:paraquat-inducible protein B [Loktanella ponticola]|uniref:Paraquat-inducible protein B n=1 Tax=Yoonia ponticola TaxID=1524255 RepID=A0A7W9BLD7_9RHOB|nr:MlaD family protein [Yoonia ponticola]MBB5722219.1 paraquat-inducible protein B [Yoonia ponticola]